MDKISLTVHVRDAEVLQRVKKETTILHTIKNKEG